MENPRHFPHSFGIYKDSKNPYPLILARKADDPSPHSFCTTSFDQDADRPNIVLHSIADLSSKIVVTGNHMAFTQTTDIRLYPPTSPTAKQCADLIKLESGDRPTVKKFFMYKFPKTDLEEKLEWKNSKGVQVKNLGGWN